MPALNVIQLQALLAEKIPGLRLGVAARAADGDRCWASGLPQMDGPLGGGLPRGALTEIVGQEKNSGSATLLRHLLGRAGQERRIAALIDGSDSFDVTQAGEEAVSRLLWVRCRGAEEALKAADLILRDSNVPIVLLDLKCNAEKQLRKIPATTWYRFQYLVEEAATVCAVFTPRPMVAPAKARVLLRRPFSLDAMGRDTAELLPELEMDFSDARTFRPSRVAAGSA